MLDRNQLFLLARCVFVTQTAVCNTKTLASVRGNTDLQSRQQRRNHMEKQSKPSSESLSPDKPRWDNWHIRLPCPKDQQKVIDLFERSGAKTKSDFVRARLLDESFKVITVDKSAIEYYRKLSQLTAQIHKIGILYNQTVKAINSYHSVKAAQVMLQRLEQYSQQIITLEQQAISLTLDYRKR